MSVIRVMGIETEYGISVPGHPNINAMLASSQIVNAYANRPGSATTGRARWDYDEETPLRDARGFDMTRADADPSALTDADIGMANAVLTNGARLYVDHAHPEYSSPEVTNPWDAMVYDRAGESIMAQSGELASAMPGAQPLRLYKNNTDNKGASYGTHENYLMSRTTQFSEIVSGLIPFFVTRQVITGAGRVGLGQEGREQGFQLSQRADFFEVEVGLETTLKRPIINTRDEPHADPALHRRLHVIVGDANMSETATYLKMGMTSLVLSLIETGTALRDLTLANPVAEIHRVSHDPSLQHKVELQDGRAMTALEVQRNFADRAANFVSREQGGTVDEQTADVLNHWHALLDKLERDPMDCADELDWVAKLQLLEGYRRRDGSDWDDPRLQLVDLQYSDMSPAKGLARKLEQRGSLKRLTTEAEVSSAVLEPPADTRAWFRGECLRRYPHEVSAASWDSVVFDIPGRPSLQRVPTLDPFRGTRAAVEQLLDSCQSGADLLAALSQG
ncbi:MAG: depupylase/deamidase Dop [Candidatus Nanopelagicales bacterium]